MSTCPNCGNDDLFEGLDSDYAYCDVCDELVEPADPEEGGNDGAEAWCDSCGDLRPVTAEGCCARCGEVCEGY